MTKMRVLEDKTGLLYVQELKFGLIWWTVFKTYSPAGAYAMASMGRTYNEVTGNFE
jgi:hypothetical protein